MPAKAKQQSARGSAEEGLIKLLCPVLGRMCSSGTEKSIYCKITTTSFHKVWRLHVYTATENNRKGLCVSKKAGGCNLVRLMPAACECMGADWTGSGIVLRRGVTALGEKQKIGILRVR
jgi:hypothetical protein